MSIEKMKRLTHVTLLAPTCKNQCTHCGYPKYSHIDFELVKNIARKLINDGFVVSFYDMNPTEKSLYIYDLIGQYTDSRSFSWLNITQDFILTEAGDSLFRDMNLGLCISIHGATPETHSKISPYLNFNNAIRKFHEMRERYSEKPIGIAMVVHQNNIGEIGAYYEMAHKIGANYVEFINLLPTGEALSQLPKSYFLDRSAKTNALKQIAYSNKECLTTLLDSTWGPVPDTYRIPPIPGYEPNACSMFAPSISGRFCGAGINHVSIRLDNFQVYPCPGMTVWPKLCVGSYSLQDGLVFEKEHFYWYKQQCGKSCFKCELFASCKGGCSITAYSEMASFTKKTPTARVTQEDCCLSIMKEIGKV